MDVLGIYRCALAELEVLFDVLASGARVSEAGEIHIKMQFHVFGGKPIVKAARKKFQVVV